MHGNENANQEKTALFQQQCWSGCEDESTAVAAVIGESCTHTHTHTHTLSTTALLPEIKRNDIRLHKAFKRSYVYLVGKKINKENCRSPLPVELNRLLKRRLRNQARPFHFFANTVPSTKANLR